MAPVEADAPTCEDPRPSRTPAGGCTGWLLLAGLTLLAVSVGLASLAAGLVSPSADVYVTNVNAEGSPNRVDNRTVTAVLLPTEDSSGGEVDLLLRVEAEAYNGTGPTTTLERNRTLEVPPPEERGRYPVLAEPSFRWTPSAGMYRVTLQVFERTPTGERVFWAEDSVLHRVGTGPNLTHGWGHVEDRGPLVDLLGDGRPDVRIPNTTAENSTGDERAWSVRAAAEPWERSSAYGWELRLTVRPPEPQAATTMELSEQGLRTILQADDDEQLSFTADEAFSRQSDREGWIVYNVSPSHPDRRGYHTLHVESETPRPLPQTWFDGYHNRFNLTAWDVTGDHQRDLSFWETSADSPSQALNQSLEDRRGEPVQIVGTLAVKQEDRGYRITLDIQRADRGPEGVWFEVNETALVEALALERPNASAHAYNLSLPPEAQLVDRTPDSTWLWIGHFSTQRVEILVGDPPEAAGEDTPGGTEGSGGDDQDTKPGGQQTDDERLVPGSPLAVFVPSGLAALLGRRARLL